MLDKLKVKLFADGADINGIREMAANPMIRGFTTNPTLMRKAGVSDYETFAREVLEVVPDLPVSFEVFADDWEPMERQALKIASWGPNINVKIPITNTKGESSAGLVERLSGMGVAVNVTAMFTLEQVKEITDALDVDTGAIVSVFAGRISDTGVDPVPVMRNAREILSEKPKAELLWASPRELLNVFHADEAGCHIITATNDLLRKLSLVGKDLKEYSRETVQMFHRDAAEAAYEIHVD
jgi:transaldolase